MDIPLGLSLYKLVGAREEGGQGRWKDIAETGNFWEKNAHFSTLDVEYSSQDLNNE